MIKIIEFCSPNMNILTNKLRKPKFVRSISHYVDVAIVGGDTAGISTAWALAKSEFFNKEDGISKMVVLNERKVPDLSVYEKSSQQKLPDKRVLTISFSTLQLLHSLGALEKMNHMLITPYRKMYVNESFGHSFMSFDDSSIDQSLLAQKQQEIFDKLISKHTYHFFGKNSLGASVEYDHIHAALYNVLEQSEKWEIIQNDPISFIRPAKTLADRSVIELESGKRIKARLIIGNDGEDSYVREVHQIESNKHAYNQHCIVRTLIHEEPLEAWYQRFLPSGPIALLPMWGNYSQLVWSVPNDLSIELMELWDEDFFKEVNNSFYKQPRYNFGNNLNTILSKFGQNNSYVYPPRVLDSNESAQFRPFAFEIKSESASEHAADRVALLGDAATKVHPITGQGFNLAMTASALLANDVIRQLRSGGDIGNYTYGLKNFAHQSKINELEVRAILEAFKKGYQDTFFGSENVGKALSFVRNIGVDLIQASPIMKYNFAFFAAGCTQHPFQYEWQK